MAEGPVLLPASPPVSAGPAARPCPTDMRLVEGNHHEQVQRLCTDYHRGKCRSFAPGLVLLEPRHTPVRVCMDRYEWPNRLGALPDVMMRFVEAEQSCAKVGKRLCTELEWELGCEGREHLPWPYGWSKVPKACNSDELFRPYSDAKLNSRNRLVRQLEVQRLWQGKPAGSTPSCQSPFGVDDMIGNVEEWVTTSRPEWPYRSSLKGGYWAKPHTGCRGTNERHGPQFRYYQIGFRCCQDPG